MALDAYAPCPCGSGKKLKFCCADIVTEMEKVVRLRENNQPHVALQILDELHKTHPTNAWVVTTRAAILVSEHRADEARRLLEPYLEAHPDATDALALFAVASISSQGYGPSKRAIYRAFQKCSQSQPTLMTGVAMGISATMMNSGRYLAARQHLALALRLARDEGARQRLFKSLLEFDHSQSIPYPLRSVHALAAYTGEDPEIQRQASAAMRLAYLGCFEPAAKLFTRLAEQEPDNPQLWYNVALCRAWSGDEAAAADPLHLAAELQTDFSTAVECETLAQLLDLRNDEEALRHLAVPFHVESVSKLLSDLDRNERLVRDRNAEGQEAGVPEAGGARRVAVYDVLDRPVPPASSLTLENVPNVLGRVIVFDATEEAPGRAVLLAYEGPRLESVQEVFQQTCGDNVRPEPDFDPDRSVLMREPRELDALDWHWHLPAELTGEAAARLEEAQWRQVLTEVWPNLPLRGLGGRTPLEAAGEPDQRVALTAAAYVLDAYCETESHVLDFDLLRERVGVEPLPPLHVDPQTPLHQLSAMQLHRLALGELTDEQLQVVLQRGLLIHHAKFAYDLLTEALRRPGCAAALDLDHTYQALVESCRRSHRREEALEWIDKARNWAKALPAHSFEATLSWEMAELDLRLESPDDPALAPLLSHLWSYYGGKLPRLRGHLQQLAEMHGVVPPWHVGAEPAEARRHDLWTPEAAASESGKKLWVPGMD